MAVIRPGRAIAASSLVAALTTLAVKALGLGRQVVVARFFGAGSEVDVYLAALLVPTVLGNVLGIAANSVVIPHLARIATLDNEDLAEHLAHALRLFARLGAGAAVLCAVLAAPLGSLLFGGGATLDISAVTTALRVLSPIAFAAVVTQGLAAGLNLRGRYVVTSTAPAIVPTAIVIALMVTDGDPTALVTGTLIGHILQLVVIGSVSVGEFRFTRKAPAKSSHVSGMWREMLAMVAAMSVLNATLLVNQVMVSRVRVGALATFDFGSRIPEFVFGLFGVVVANVIAPSVAEAYHSTAPATFHRSLKQTLSVASGLGALVALALTPATTFLVRVMFEGGAFESSMVGDVASVQRWMVLATPFYFVVLVGARYMNALGRSRFVAYFGVMHLAITVIGNLIAIPRLGVGGVAAVFALAYVVSAILYVLGLTALTRRRGT